MYYIKEKRKTENTKKTIFFKIKKNNNLDYIKKKLENNLWYFNYSNYRIFFMLIQ